MFLNLNESRLERFGISLGFHYTVLDIIEDLVCSCVVIMQNLILKTCISLIQRRSLRTHGNEPSPSEQQSIGCLELNDLRRVQDSVWEARVQWYNLGLGLDITADTLDSIELANAQNPDRCFRAMLTKWLREHEKPTWNALAEALRSRSVGLAHLAEEILQQQNL